MYTDYNTENADCQAFSATIEQIKIHKKFHTDLFSALLDAFKLTSHWSQAKADRLRACGDYVCVAPDGRIIGANFCKNRYCPICQWRASRRMFGHVARVSGYLREFYPDYEHLFLTLTLKSPRRLSDGLCDVLRGFNNLTHDRTFRRAQKGFLRSVEVTYNDASETWHPHIHSILAVDKTYFTVDYLSQSEWSDLWKRATGIDYTPIIDIRKVSDDRTGAIAEVAKYAVKPSSLSCSHDSVSVYAELLNATFNRRMRSFGGVFREAVKALGLDLDAGLMDICEDEYARLSRSSVHMYYKNGTYVLKTIDDMLEDIT